MHPFRGWASVLGSFDLSNKKTKNGEMFRNKHIEFVGFSLGNQQRFRLVGFPYQFRLDVVAYDNYLRIETIFM